MDILFIIILPLISFFVTGCFGRKLGKHGIKDISLILMGLCLTFSIISFIDIITQNVIYEYDLFD